MMLSRRLFIGCGLCAVTEFAAISVAAQTNPPAPTGLKRTILSQTDGPAAGFVTLAVAVEIEPGFLVARHTHPGIESSYIIEGTSTMSVEGQPDRAIKAGDAFQIQTGVPHSVQNGPAMTRLIANYIVEKGKPLVSPA